MSGPAVIGKERAPAISTIGRNGARDAMDGSCAAAAGAKAESGMSNVVMTVVMIVAETTGAMMTGAAIIARQDKQKKAIASPY